MKKLFKWLLNGILILLALVGIIFLIGIFYILFQPSLPQNAQKVQEEYLISSDYRPVADSALLWLQEVAEELHLPSVSVAVGIDNEQIWAASIGMADIKEEKASSLDTRYRAGSVSKSMTGLLAAKLASQKTLDLDASIDSYVDHLPARDIQPTLRQLGAHTGGIRHYSGPGHSAFFDEQFSQKHYTSVREALGIFIGDSLQFSPGEGFQYSTHGFTLLSAALEKATEESYLELVQKHIWDAAGMTNTRPDNLREEDLHRAKPYTELLKRMVYLEGPDPSYKWAGGGILTTPTDLVAMGGAFLTGGITGVLPSDSLFTPISLGDGSKNPQNYSMGFRNDHEKELLGYDHPVHVMHHGGSSPGGSSFLLMIPRDTLAASAMTNLSLKNAWPLRKKVYKIAGVFGKRHKQLVQKDSLQVILEKGAEVVRVEKANEIEAGGNTQ